MVKAPTLKEVKHKRFGVFTVLNKFSDGRHTYFTCRCGQCENILDKRWGDLHKGANKFCNNCRTAPLVKPHGEASFNRLKKVYIDAAKSRGIYWGLTDKEFKELTSSNCHYCGIPPKQKIKGLKNKKGKYKLNGQYYHNGVDRKDSKQPYVCDNCVPCCKYCNLGKNDQTYEEYLDRIGKIYKNLITGEMK